VKFSRRLGRATSLGAIACVSLAVAACGDDEKNADAAAGRESVKIGFINLSDQVPFSLSVRKSVEAAAKEHQVELVTCDSRLAVEKAIACAQQFKIQGVQGIANFQADQAGAARVCEAGPDVPVVAVDIPQEPCQDVFFGADNFNAGRIAGATLGEFAKKTWNCDVDGVISINSPANKLVKVREDGSLEGLRSQCPDVKVSKVAPSAYTTDATIQPFTDTLTRLGGMDRLLVLAVNDDVGIGAVKGAQAAGRLDDIYVVGQGADQSAWPYICGETSFKNWIGDAGYFPERYGADILPILLNLIEGKKEPATAYLKHEAVTPENIRSLYPDACKEGASPDGS
jgi:ribose transport system substrate-binding protein